MPPGRFGMNYQDYLKDANKAVEDAFQKIVKRSEREYWEELQSQNWHTQLDQDEAAVQDFLTLGER